MSQMAIDSRRHTALHWEIERCALGAGVVRAIRHIGGSARLNRTIVSLLAVCAVALTAAVPLWCDTIVDIPLNEQIDTGLGPAVSSYSGFETEGEIGFCRKYVDAGGWYFGPTIDFVKAGYGPWVDMSRPGTEIHYTARYFQGGGNTNPYGDAPIFIHLTDSSGRNGGLDISYGPNPSPVFPEWIECTDTIETTGWPTDPGFDASKVVSVTFFGTDWGGTGDDFIDIRNLQVTVPREFDAVPIAEARQAEDGSYVETGGVATAVFELSSCFYIQTPGHPCGIQVRADTLPDVGRAVDLAGIVGTDPDTGERYIEAEEWVQGAPVPVRPLHMSALALGGAGVPGQGGVDGGTGANNVGVLAELTGVVTYEAPFCEYMYLDDGSGFDDGPDHPGVRLDFSQTPTGLRPNAAAGDRLTVTGVSSIYLAEGGARQRVLHVAGSPVRENYFSDGNEPVTLRAIVINFDPYCPSYGNARTHEVFGWYDPPTQIDRYIQDLNRASGGWCNYEVVGWYDADYHPYFEDGFAYGADEYVHAWQHRDTEPLHEGMMDYVRLVTDLDYPHNQPATIAERVASGEVDEVFLFGAPAGMAAWEAAMAGPSPFFVNGGTYNVPSSQRNFIVMGFNYERDVDCMLEDFLHRTECVMSRVYDPPEWWFPTWPLTNNWDRFRMFDSIQPGEAAVGICHFAPNSESDYDWGNPAWVWSMCDDWRLNWPDLVGESSKRMMNCQEWGNGDSRLHKTWWLEHLPRASGVNADGRQNNWWKYTCTYDRYPESW